MPATVFIPWTCAVCGARNSAEIDYSAGHHQEYTEDCATCCRPHLLRVDINNATQDVALEAHPENE